MWLPIEFIGQGAMAGLVLISAMPVDAGESEAPRKLANGCLSVVGVTILILGFSSLVTGWSSQELPALAWQLVLPVWMTLGVLPYIYLVALLAAYGQAFTWIDFPEARSRRVGARSRVAIAMRLRGRVASVGKFNVYWARRVAEARSLRAAVTVVDDFARGLARKNMEKKEGLERIAAYAGFDGTDEDGRRLDRREFMETTKALGWIATCQMGWGRRETGYRADILDVVGDLSSHGLRGNDGIEVHVSTDGGS